MGNVVKTLLITLPLTVFLGYLGAVGREYAYTSEFVGAVLGKSLFLLTVLYFFIKYVEIRIFKNSLLTKVTLAILVLALSAFINPVIILLATIGAIVVNEIRGKNK